MHSCKLLVLHKPNARIKKQHQHLESDLQSEFCRGRISNKREKGKGLSTYCFCTVCHQQDVHNSAPNNLTHGMSDETLDAHRVCVGVLGRRTEVVGQDGRADRWEKVRVGKNERGGVAVDDGC